jgi:UDP-GlcNAc:undecaprenyl-phosphate GlcNAc-1-phosphate transferase
MTHSAASVASLAISGIVAAILTPALARASRKAGWLDRPDGQRKKHDSPVPLSGGCAVMAAVLAGYFLAASHVNWLLLGSIAIIFTIGLVDDVVGLPAWAKVAIQVVAASLALVSGVRVGTGIAGALLTVAWLLLCTNALNLVDGLDGLAPTVSLFAAVAMLLMSNAARPLLIPLIGALVGFLWFNLPPAKVYLGDSGSLTIGFLLGCAAVETSGGSARTLMGPALALSLPLFDTIWAVVRRLSVGKPLFAGDRGHIHHRVLERTGSARAALTLLSAVSFGASAIGVAMDFLMFRIF